MIFLSGSYCERALQGGKIKNAKLRARTDRQHVYLVVKWILPHKKSQSTTINLAEKLAGVTVLEDWKMVQDESKCISFVRLEKWEFKKRRLSTAVVISQTGDLTYLPIRTVKQTCRM